MDTTRIFLALTSLSAETANLIEDANLLLKLVPRRAKQRPRLDHLLPKSHAVVSPRTIILKYKWNYDCIFYGSGFVSILVQSCSQQIKQLLGFGISFLNDLNFVPLLPQYHTVLARTNSEVHQF